jgi:hypothetical protein
MMMFFLGLGIGMLMGAALIVIAACFTPMPILPPDDGSS